MFKLFFLQAHILRDTISIIIFIANFNSLRFRYFDIMYMPFYREFVFFEISIRKYSSQKYPNKSKFN